MSDNSERDIYLIKEVLDDFTKFGEKMISEIKDLEKQENEILVLGNFDIFNTLVKAARKNLEKIEVEVEVEEKYSAIDKIQKFFFNHINSSYDRINKYVEDAQNNVTDLNDKDSTNILNATILHTLLNKVQEQITDIYHILYKYSRQSEGDDQVLLRDYLNRKVEDFWSKYGNFKLENIKNEVKRFSEDIRDILPRTKSEHVGVSMHIVKNTENNKKNIKGGKNNKVFLINIFDGYSRKDLNIISKHYGLKDAKKVKNKKKLINMLNTITNYRIGNIKRRRNLNSFATLLNINPKLYKKKSYLIKKLNKTIF